MRDIGPYVLDEIAGRGGMGMVYRAHHRQTGQAVALKTVIAVRPDLAGFLEREIAGLSHLDHPQIVSIVEHGTDASGQPWLAMEWLEGCDLSSLLPAKVQEGEPIPTARLAEAADLAIQLCRPLQWMHGHGWIHGDLKPSNIRIVDGTPILLDLGLARAVRDLEGREDSTGAGELGGSRSYMAPEHRRGELLDGRTDLWALGAVVVARLCGRPPSRRSPVESVRRLGLPPRWTELLGDLLQRDPRARPAFADTVADRFAALVEGSAPIEGPPALHRPRCAGRDGVIDDLVKIGLEGGVGSIAGRSGHGKTRVLLEVANRLVLARRSLVGGAAERGDARPFALLQPLLRTVQRRAQREGPAQTAEGLSSALPILRAVSTQLDDLPGVADIAPAGIVAPDQARDRLAKALWQASDWLGASLFFDDIQWADARFLDLLPALIAARPATRALILAWRDDETPPAVRALDLHPHRLGPLPDGAISELLADMLAEPVHGGDVIEEITTWAEGNPWFAAEMLRAAVDGHALCRRRGSWLREGALPAARTVERLVDTRWDALTQDEREIVEVAAVLGRRWEPELATDILGRELSLGSLTRRGWFERDADGAWTFTHSTLRDGALDRMEPQRRRQRHRQSADLLTARRGSDRSLDIAQHRADAGQDEQAIEIWTKIARGHPFLPPDVVIVAGEGLLAMGDAVPRETQVLAYLWIHNDHTYMRRLDEAKQARERLVRDYLDIEGVERLSLGMQIEEDRGIKPLEHNLALCDRALTLPRFGNRTHDIFLLSIGGNMLLDVGRVKEALERFQEAFSRIDASARARPVRSIYLYLGKAHGALHQWDEMESWFTQLEAFEGVGDGLVATMEWCRAQREIAEDDLDAAHRRLVACRETFLRIAGQLQVLGTESTLAEVELAMGDLDAAWARIDTVTRQFESSESTALWEALLVRARLSRMRGQRLDDTVLATLESKCRGANNLHGTLRAQLERHWDRAMSPSEAETVERSLLACQELMQPGSLLYRLREDWERRPQL